jgi:DNA-binding MarR family transcriptional regulator
MDPTPHGIQSPKIASESPREQSNALPIEESTYLLIVRAAARLEGELNRLFRPFDLTVATYEILKVLALEGGVGRSCGEIGEHLVAEVPDMTRLLDRLERLGYTVRERSSVDRRMVRVSLTPMGREVLDKLREQVRDRYIRQLGHLGSNKLNELSSLLQVVLESPIRRKRR